MKADYVSIENVILKNNFINPKKALINQVKTCSMEVKESQMAKIDFMITTQKWIDMNDSIK